jgi:protein TonB
MFGSLIESRRTRAYGGALGGGAVSAVVHSALITGAVYATIRASEPGRDARIIVPVSYREPPKPPAPAPPVRGPGIPVIGSYVLLAPVATPTEIPPPSSVPFDPMRFTGSDSAAEAPWGREPLAVQPAAPGSVYSTDVVEERPERIGGPAPRYPEILREAGIDGQVAVECVVDTAGRAELGSVRVVSSTNPLFDPAAREAVAASLFRPGRLGGRVVRVRVLVPLSFQVSRR